MILTPPFWISGEEDKSLDLTPVSLAALGVHDGVVTWYDLDPDVFTFSLWDNGSRPLIPDDGQWITLKDDAGQVLLVGRAKRSFEYPARIYRFTVKNVYEGLTDTQLVGANGRPYISYYSDDLANTLQDILRRAADTGLPIGVPDEMPTMYAVPKMSFRGTTCAASIEDALKWLPGASTRMDYETTPQTLRFYCRDQAAPFVINLYAGVADRVTLEADLDVRAAGIQFSYAVRSGDTTVTLATQQAGDPQAAGVARQSAYLTGADRLDAFLAEALVASLYAQEEVNKLIVAGGGTVDDGNPAVDLSWESCLALDTAGGLAGAVAAEPAFKMSPANGQDENTGDDWYQYATGSSTLVGPYNNDIDIGTTPLYLASSAGTPLGGWYAVDAGFFSTAELAAVGVSLQSGKIRGDLVKSNVSLSFTPGESHLVFNALNSRRIIQKANGKIWTRYTVNCPVDAINVPPSVAISLLNSNNDGFNAKLVTRAGYADIPADLAANYFARQDWVPYKGTIEMLPGRDFPRPGDFVSIVGEDALPEWATMAAPISSTLVNLSTGAATVSVGSPARLSYRNISDRLRIPAEDNYQPG